MNFATCTSSATQQHHAGVLHDEKVKASSSSPPSIETFYDLASSSSLFGGTDDGTNMDEYHHQQYQQHGCTAGVRNSFTTKQIQEEQQYLAHLEKKELCHVLDEIVAKIGIFYLNRCEELSQSLDVIMKVGRMSSRGTRDHDSSNNTSTAVSFSLATTTSGSIDNATSFCAVPNDYKQLGKEILELYGFVGVNLTALRQILIHYDCLICALNGAPLGEWYMNQRRNISARKHEDSLFEAIVTRSRLTSLTDQFIFYVTYIDGPYGHWMNDQISRIEMNIQITEQVVDVAVGDWWASLAYYFIAGSLLSDLLLSPRFIRARETTLIKYMEFYVRWRKYFFNISSSVDGNDVTRLIHDAPVGGPRKLKDVITPPILLNFTAHLLYMTGHYIVEPTSLKYIRNLGGDDALASTLVGMVPWAALMSSFLYSLWSNTSFREPLLWSGVFLMGGSLIYAMAFEFHSVSMAMLGRFLQGLGAPTVICVRHISDTVRSADRTVISAILVTVGALGMCFGPGLAVLLDFVDSEVYIPMFGSFTVNGMTAPGYLMFLFWSLYYVAIIMYFYDGERFGLLEKSETAVIEDDYEPPPRIDKNVTDRKTVEEFDHQEKEDETKPSATVYMNEATAVCIVMKFIGKFVLEILGCSISLITMHRYAWSVRNIGALSFVNGCLMMPISTLVGYLSHSYSDVILLRGLLCSALVGTLLLIDVTDFVNDESEDQQPYNEGQFGAIGPKRYILGIVLQFCSYQAAQSVVLSMTSKVVPLSLAKGTFNTGFISTAMAALARAVGNTFITVMAYVSTRQLLNLLAVPSVILTVFCLGLSIFHGRQLSP